MTSVPALSPVDIDALRDVAERDGLYRPSLERDACGVGFLADIAGRPRRDVVTRGLTALERLKTKRLDDNEDYRTPWERLEPAPAIIAYELAQLHRSVENLEALGWIRR